MKPKLNATLTPARLSVLKHVRDHPGYDAPCNGPTRSQVWQLGWIEAVKNAQGQMLGHQLTDAGREILTAHELGQITKPGTCIDSMSANRRLKPRTGNALRCY